MKSKVILLVEDNPDDEALTLRALNKGKIKNEVVVTRDGAEALEYLFATGKYADRNVLHLPQIVLLDLKLPKLDGHAVLKQIRSNAITRTLPVVILTSSKEDRDIVESYDNGANSFVCKPVGLDEFTDAVRQLEVYWMILNER